MNNDYETVTTGALSDAENNPWGFNGKANGKCLIKEEEAVFYLECYC